MQAAQIIAGSAPHAKELHGPAERSTRAGGTYKNSSVATGKKSSYEGQLLASKMEASTTKKLIFSFKKNEKQKVTPTNEQTNLQPKTSSIG